MNKKTIYFAVKALIINKGSFLALHRKGVSDDWLDLPGGRMEFGETAEETVIREVVEETGLFVTPLKILDTWNNVRADYQITGIIYLCKMEDGEVKLSDEHDEYKWLKADGSQINYMHNVFKEKMANWNWNNIF